MLMPASVRQLVLLGVGIVAYATAASLIGAAIVGPVPKNPTCLQLRDDTTRRQTVVRLTQEFEPPPKVTRAELSQTVEAALTTDCDRLRSEDGGEGRRRPRYADLGGTGTRRLRELEARRR